MRHFQEAKIRSLFPSILFVQDADANNLYYHDDNLLHTALNLFAAGTDTTADTLQWGLLFITKYPHIQGAKTWSVD